VVVLAIVTIFGDLKIWCCRNAKGYNLEMDNAPAWVVLVLL